MCCSLATARTRLAPPCAAAIVLLAALATSGCGDSDSSFAPKTEKQREYETKVQALMKEGKSFAEVRAIMKGEPLKKPKKARGKRR